DYRDKTDLTAQKLATTLYAALRSYRDIVRLKALSEDLAAAKSDAEAAAAARDAFLRTAAHDLHTPLNAIVGYSDLIGRQPYGPLGDERYIEYVWDINASGRALLAMVDNILQAAAGAGETMELKEEAFDLAECVDDCLGRLSVAENASIRLRTRTGDAVRLFADRLAVQRMVLALLVNALKQSADGGHFEIAARRLGDGRLILSVIDDKPERGGSDDGARSLGAGIARVLIERHGGQLTFERRPGGGARANLIFPKERVPEPGEQER
ncbi:MAG: HAMP domain-containing sensor histidine kinase, partial [Alphaproteobacteria bacterium]